MTDRLPWFPFYAGDWLADLKVRMLTTAQRGVYADLLAFQWREGVVPNDGPGLAAMLGADGADVSLVLDRFFPADTGGRRNARLERERAKQDQRHQRASTAGAKGAAARWQGHSNPNGDPNAAAVRPDCHSEPDAEPESETRNVYPPGTCPLQACDGAGAVRAKGGRILRTCKCPEGRKRAKRFATLCEADERAKAEKLPPATDGPAAELAQGIGKPVDRPSHKQAWACRHCGELISSRGEPHRSGKCKASA